jgi:hypothetical protein
VGVPELSPRVESLLRFMVLKINRLRRRILRALLISFSGGVLIPLLLFATAMMLGESLEHRWGHGWLANLLMFSVVGPMVIWERVFPHSPSCPSCGPTDTAMVATIVTVFLFYSISTYLIQVLIGRFRRGDLRK